MVLGVEQSIQAPLTKEVRGTLCTRSPDVEIHISDPDKERRIDHLILNETGPAIPGIDIELDERKNGKHKVVCDEGQNKKP